MAAAAAAKSSTFQLGHVLGGRHTIRVNRTRVINVCVRAFVRACVRVFVWVIFVAHSCMPISFGNVVENSLKSRRVEFRTYRRILCTEHVKRAVR